MKHFYKLLFACISFFFFGKANGQNLGFEAPAATPPTNWSAVTGTWTNTTTGSKVRSGIQAMTVTDPATSGTTIGTTNPFVTTTTAGNYLITIGWGKSNTASNAAFYLGYRTGTANTLNPSTTTAPVAPYVLNNTSWTRITGVSSATVAAGTYGASLRAFRTSSTTGTELYIDDIIMYASTSATPDYTAPNPATNAAIAGNALSWTNSSDNGSPASGIGGVVILRADGVSLPAPTLNDQAMYNSVNGAAGIGSFVQGGNTWTVLTDIQGASTTTYTDATASGGPYTYVIFMRDLAYNYSTGVTVGIASPCTEPPTAGTSSVNPSVATCATLTRTLSLSGNSFGTGQSYRWQSSATLGGTYIDVSSSLTSSGFSINPTITAYYRCAVTCGASTTYSTPVQVLVNPAVSGVFNIDSGQPTSGSNFQTFADAINSLQCGINGPVTFNVLAGSGPYNEQLKIDPILGASATNTITINGNGATLNFGSLATATTRHGIHLNGADYVRINNLIVDGTTSTTAAWGIVLTAQADNNIVSNCTINIGNLISTSTNFIGIALNGVATTTATSGNNGNGNQFLNNNINGGYYNYYLYGNSASTTQNINNIIKGGTLQDAYAYGIYAIYQSTGLIIDSLDITRPGRTVSTTTGGVFITTGTVGALIQRNKIHNLFDLVTTPTSTSYGIYIGTDATTANPTKVINNLIYNIGGNGTSYGVYNTSGDSMQVYHNTIALNDAVATTATAYGIYQTTLATGIDVKNNIFYVTRSGTGIKRCIYFVTATTTFSSNNNVFYMNAGGGTDNKVAQFGATSYTALADWQASNTNAFDQASYELDPTFANAGSGDFKPTNSVLDSKGTPVGVLKDILDSTRSTTSPDLGAYEFSTITAGINFGPESLIAPALSTSGCYTNAENVTVKIRNSSSITHNFVTNPVTVTMNVTGAITQTLSATVNTGTLQSDSTLNVTFSSPLDMSVSGVYNFAANTTLAGDVNLDNDAMLPVTRTKNTLSAGTIAAAPASYCANGGILPTLNVTGHSGYNSLQWQVSTTSGSGYSNITAATTSTFITTNAITQNQYYILTAVCGSSIVTSGETTVTYVNPGILSTTAATRCGTGTVNISATPSTGASINWYAAASGGSSLATGNTFTTPSISATTTYYASAGFGTNGNVGPASPAIGTTSASNIAIGTQGGFFDVLAPSGIVINSVDVYPTSTIGSTFTIEIRNSAGTTIYTSPAYTTTVTGGTTPQTVALNANIPFGTGYKIGQGTAINLTRNTTGAVYPYTLSSVISLTGNTFDPVYYYFFYNWQVTSGCESARTAVVATVDNTPGCSTVPVSLINFNAIKQNGISKLSWNTTTEINNAGFYIERSVDGINFSSIGFIDSKALNGNSNSVINYSFDDKKVLNGNNYYRLKQVDRDGKFTYSITVLLKHQKTKDLAINTIYPNPSSGNITLSLEASFVDPLTIIVTDVTGKVVLKTTKTVELGTNNIKLATENLLAGTYFIKVTCLNGCETGMTKFVKQ